MFKGTAADKGVWWDSMVMDHAVLRLGWSNFAAVIPGKLYRSNHPTPGRLARLHARFGLRTLVNLRGKRDCGSRRRGWGWTISTWRSKAVGRRIGRGYCGFTNCIRLWRFRR